MPVEQLLFKFRNKEYGYFVSPCSKLIRNCFQCSLGDSATPNQEKKHITCRSETAPSRLIGDWCGWRLLSSQLSCQDLQHVLSGQCQMSVNYKIPVLLHVNFAVICISSINNVSVPASDWYTMHASGRHDNLTIMTFGKMKSFVFCRTKVSTLCYNLDEWPWLFLNSW
jgi:hypothetical protein